MTIDTNLDKMDDILEEAWNLPFSGGKRMIDIEKMRNLIDDIRLNMPRELKEAKSIVADREDIIHQARLEAEDIIKRAESKARGLISEEEITKAAKEKADALLSDTGRKTREMQTAAVAFTENELAIGEAALMKALSEIKAAKTALRTKK